MKAPKTYAYVIGSKHEVVAEVTGIEEGLVGLRIVRSTKPDYLGKFSFLEIERLAKVFLFEANYITGKFTAWLPMPGSN